MWHNNIKCKNSTKLERDSVSLSKLHQNITDELQIMTALHNQIAFEFDDKKSNYSIPRYIELSAGALCWIDALLNGVEDVAGEIPGRNNGRWDAVIDLESGHVLDWPDGIEADIYYKVCDEGKYWLLNEHKERIATWSGFYVPNDILCIGDNGFGDYIILKIEKKGMIVKWKKPDINPDEWTLI